MGELIAVVVVLWLLNIIRIPWLTMPHFTAFTIGGFSVTIERLLIMAIVAWLASSLGSPFRQILWAFAILWLLSILGLVVIGNMTMLVVIAVVVGLILSAVQKN